MSKKDAAPAPVSFVEITDCCCGSAHRMKRTAWEKFQREIKGKLPTVPVGGGLAAWRVPRIYIACHGIISGDLPALAEQYGWAEV
jgi:hypothetical protein